MDTISTGRRPVVSRTVLLDPTPRPISLGSKAVPVPPGPAPRGPAVLPVPDPGPGRADVLPAAVLDDLLTLPGALYAGIERVADGQVLAEAGRTGAEARASVRYLAGAVRTALGTFAADPVTCSTTSS